MYFAGCLQPPWAAGTFRRRLGNRTSSIGVSSGNFGVGSIRCGSIPFTFRPSPQPDLDQAPASSNVIQSFQPLSYYIKRACRSALFGTGPESTPNVNIAFHGLR